MVDHQRQYAMTVSLLLQFPVISPSWHQQTAALLLSPHMVGTPSSDAIAGPDALPDDISTHVLLAPIPYEQQRD
jgi:hypothetical protein